MPDLLQLAGAVFIAFILFLIVGYFYLKWKWKKLKSNIKGGVENFFNQIQDTIQSLQFMDIPPFRIKLEEEEFDELYQKKSQELIEKLKLKALELGANSIIGLNIQVAPYISTAHGSDPSSSPSHYYQLKAHASACWSRKVGA